MNLLRKFYAEVKSEKGQPLTPSTLTGIRAAIHRQLTSAPISRSMNIMQDSEILLANKMFEAKCKLYTKEMNPKPTHKSSIAAGDMLKLRGYFSEGLDSNNSWADPEQLLQFVWFSLCFHFGRRGREGWRELIIIIANVSVEFGSKERPRNGVFGILPARKMGREPKIERLHS